MGCGVLWRCKGWGGGKKGLKEGRSELAVRGSVEVVRVGVTTKGGLDELSKLSSKLSAENGLLYRLRTADDENENNQANPGPLSVEQEEAEEAPGCSERGPRLAWPPSDAQVQKVGCLVYFASSVNSSCRRSREKGKQRNVHWFRDYTFRVTGIGTAVSSLQHRGVGVRKGGCNILFCPHHPIGITCCLP